MASGVIRIEEAYAQGKMLNNAKWKGFLPRGSTPSDIDMVFQDMQHQRILFCELSRRQRYWRDVTHAQRHVYIGAITSGQGKSLAVLLNHNVPASRQIDTYSDIVTFQIMSFAALLGYTTSSLFNGSDWPNFVKSFYSGSERNLLSRLKKKT